jgi:hypothetical protein
MSTGVGRRAGLERAITLGGAVGRTSDSSVAGSSCNARPPSTAAEECNTSRKAASTGFRVDWWIPALGRSGIRLGPRTVGSPATSRCRVGLA